MFVRSFPALTMESNVLLTLNCFSFWFVCWGNARTGTINYAFGYTLWFCLLRETILSLCGSFFNIYYMIVSYFRYEIFLFLKYVFRGYAFSMDVWWWWWWGGARDQMNQVGKLLMEWRGCFALFYVYYAYTFLVCVCASSVLKCCRLILCYCCISMSIIIEICVMCVCVVSECVCVSATTRIQIYTENIRARSLFRRFYCFVCMCVRG